jgi:2'-5' RNA ligase
VHRLFVAAWPPADVVADLERLPRAPSPGVRWVRPEHWHVTLRFLGDAEPERVAARLRATRLPRSEAVLGPVVSRIGRSTVALPTAGLDALAAAVVSATADLGTPPDPRPFRGHLTLARLRHRAACGVAGARLTARFAVDEVVLIDSTLGADGPTYAVVTRVPTT